MKNQKLSSLFPFHFALQHLYDELLCCVFSLYISK